MMPTFPRSPLSFRTAGFSQYGWKDLEETKNQILRLNQVFQKLDEKQGVKCPAIDGLISETDDGTKPKGRLPRHGANGCGSLAGDSPSVLNNTAQR
jgi:Domain of unknown function (DUF892)